MNKQEIKSQLSDLLMAEESILFKLSTEYEIDAEQTSFVIKKLFEISEMILRLKIILKEIKHNEG